MEKALSFPTEIHEKIGYYVYRLIDPRDGSTFYVGKGRGNRVFAHVQDAAVIDGLDVGEDSISLKLRQIREIRACGLEPLHTIHRHGLTSEEAFLAEAVLIDAIPGLTNATGGHGSDEFGPANALQIINKYRAEPIELLASDKIVAINVRLSAGERSLYDAVRYAWKVSIERVNKADYVLAVRDGICDEVFVPDKPWIPATTVNFEALPEDMPGRFGFAGKVAGENIRRRFVGKHMSGRLKRAKGMANPILYSFD